ncbi:50S ribosomal protein L32e [Candidatus Pacearchaeota archaeon CG_4_9_14_0_2_um_filter_39_13]|nr:50S ribosomal protein L32e [Candidatus Pacearchaeota archaeon]OIO44296.1 MAG: hypothetical protein AUJ64_00360 [Candidatus Pacearchaeota archaeon CG1_02_39_14]PJC44348.1 MAG: 50S ribosomal protein L32e [Candidatus Pacearchaeota archaeon CG_4_9_14_0_2_um_filter_39_13]
MKFQRTDSMRFSKLGKNRKKKQKWRAAKGRDNKIREKRKGYPKAPSTGYKRPRKEAGKINGKMPVRVENIKELERVGKDSIVIIARVGAKKKIELLKRAEELKLPILNIGRKK